MHKEDLLTEGKRGNKKGHKKAQEMENSYIDATID